MQWTNDTGQPISFINVRASIPDSAGGGGITATLDLYANGTFRQALNLNSIQSWQYEGNNNYSGNDQNPAGGGTAATGATDSTAAIQNCVNQAQSQGKILWIPQGTFYLVGTAGIVVNNVTVEGAGYLYSQIYRDVPLPNNTPLGFTTSSSGGPAPLTASPSSVSFGNMTVGQTSASSAHRTS